MRNYLILFGVAWVSAVIVAGARAASGALDVATMLPVILLLPLAVPAVFWGLSVGMFFRPYSAIGAREVTEPPKTEPTLIVKGSFGGVGTLRATAPFVSWTLYESGLGIKIACVGEGFLKVSEIERVEGRTVHHRSRELRSPVVVGADSIVEALKELMSRLG